MSSTTTRIPLIYGAAAFGNPNSNGPRIYTLEESQEVVDVFLNLGFSTFDTASVYGYGSSEEFLGKLKLGEKAVVDTKVSPRNPGDHAPEKLRSIVEKSVKSLGPYKINVLYLHAPDRTVPYEDTLRELDALHKAGVFKELGLSNYNSWEVTEFVYLAKANGWIAPTVYQGLYNALQRSVEYELLPCLRKFGIRFYAYSPLAGGLLTGRYRSEKDMDNNSGGRWDPKATVYASFLRSIYVPLLPMFADLDTALSKHNIPTAEAAYRWLQHHSALTPQDAVIIGANSAKQLEQNVKDSMGGPLPEDVLAVVEAGWKTMKGGSTHYAM